MTVEKMLYVLSKQYVPDGKELEMLIQTYKELKRRIEYEEIVVVDIYNAGKMAGIRQERQRRNRHPDRREV